MFRLKLIVWILVMCLVSFGFIISVSAIEHPSGDNEEHTALLMHFNEGTGLPKDSSVYGNNALANTATWTSEGKSGSALLFDGIDDYVDLGNPAILGGMSKLTIEAWIKRSDTGTGDQVIVSSWAQSYHFEIINNRLQFHIWTDVTGQIAGPISTTTFSDGQWHHVAGTYDGSWVRIYVDGVEEGTPVAASGNIRPSSTTKVMIGAAEGWGPGLFFKGFIDGVRVLRVDRIDENDTLLLMHFNEGTGLPKDSSVYGNNALANTATWTSEGKSGSALLFDGIDDYVDLGNPAILGGMSKLTIEAWIKRSDTGTSDQVIVSNWIQSYHFEIINNRLQFHIWTDVTGQVTGPISTTTFSDGLWHHVAGTYDGSWVRIYVDGVEEGTPVAASGNIRPVGGGKVMIGAAEGWGPGLFFKGYIDEVHISRIVKIPENGTALLMHFNEGSGLPKDSSVYSNNVLANTATWTVTGKYYSALLFDGIDDYVDLGSPAILGGMSKLTIEAWIKRSDTGTSDQVIVSNWIDSYHFEIINNRLQFHIWTDVTGQVAGPISTTTFSDGLWHHVAGTYDGSWVRIYVDGVEEGTPVAASGNIRPVGGGKVMIGAAEGWGPGLFFKGYIDEVRISRVARSPAGIQESANDPAPFGLDESNYIVFKEGTTVYAQNGQTGKFDFSSTNAATVIQSAVDNGKLIHIKEGIYELSSSIVITGGNKNIIGAGRRATILKLANGINQDVIKGNGTVLEGLSFGNFGIDGNKINNTIGNGLNLTGMVGAVVENVEINNVVQYGIYADGNTIISNGITLQDVWISSCGLDGIRFQSCYGMKTYSVYTNSNLGNGIVLKDGGETTLCGVSTNGDIKVGILLDNTSKVNIIGGYASMTGEEGLRIQLSSSKINVIGLTAYQCATGTGVAGIRVMDTASNIKVASCVATASSKKGFSLEGTADYILVQSNDFSGNTGGAVADTSNGTHNKFTRNIGYVTENGGVASVKNGDTIAHGLAGTPTIVVLTPSANRTIACTAKDATTITISLFNNNNPITTPENVYWYVEK